MPQKKGTKANALSPQEQVAVDAHLAGKSQKDALREANYAESTIDAQAHRFFNRPKIIAAITKAMGPAMKAPEVLARVSHKARYGKDDAIQMDALKTLAKHHKLLTDKLEATGADGAPIAVSISGIRRE